MKRFREEGKTGEREERVRSVIRKRRANRGSINVKERERGGVI